jgi:hypothetical protein
MQSHVWVVMVKWCGRYWGIESEKAWKTKKEALQAMKRHPFYSGITRGHMKVVKFVPHNAAK